MLMRIQEYRVACRWSPRTLCGLALLCALPRLANAAPDNLADLSLDELANIQITSLSRRPERLNDAPASVFVITRDDIRRAGVTSIPEALRLAPGVEVGRIGAHAWAISIRGFNNDLANKLLVLIDGRSVYSPLYSGVFWDVQDTLLEDLDRIEVISGPGGTMWGANAVNGVINIITRPAADTLGGHADIGGGAASQRAAALRYGMPITEQVKARAYIKYLAQGAGTTVANSSANDAWNMLRAGVRIDAVSGDDHIVVLGEAYDGKEDGMFRGPFTFGTLPGPATAGHTGVAGRSLLARVTRTLPTSGELQCQFYVDHTERSIPNTFGESRTTYDVDVQHHLQLAGRHDLVWGAGYRLSKDAVVNSTFVTFLPVERSDPTASVFMQDKIDLWDRKLFLTLGSKFEHNHYTGYATQPNMRLNWLFTPHHSAWLAASRALRIPSRLDTDVRLIAPNTLPNTTIPVYVQLSGKTTVEAEQLRAYEAGYRIQPTDTISLDLAVFHNRYDQLGTTESAATVFHKTAPVYVLQPSFRANGLQGVANGGTMAVKWQPLPQWRMQLHYATILMNLATVPGSVDKNAGKAAGNSPRHQLSFFSFADLPHDVSIYAGARYVGQLANLKVAQYLAVDTSISWKPSPALELSLTANNLNSAGHVEYINGTALRQERRLLARASFQF